MDITALEKKIKHAAHCYYNGEPVMSDQDFDKLVTQLEALKPDSDALAVIGAPVETTAWPKVAHKSVIGSQNKVNTQEEWEKWAEGKGGFNGFLVTYKADGATIVATYKNGTLVHAVTRGDGIEGEDITPNFLQMQNTEEHLLVDFTGTIRGEIVIPVQTFLKVFHPQGYKNARNAGNGVSRDKKGGDRLKHLKVVWFDLEVDVEDKTHIAPLTELEKLNTIRQDLGLLTIEHKHVATAHQVWIEYERINKLREYGHLEYEIDGLVVKVNNLDESEGYGITHNRPKGQVAIKFPNLGAKTLVKEITWQVGITGRITPVAELEPVDIGGVTISRATLNNIDYIRELGVKPGDVVYLVRANDVIPRILEVSVDGGGAQEEPPKNCPTCDELLMREGAYVVCPNMDCSGKTYGDMMRFIQRLQVKGIGPRVLRELISAGIDNVVKLLQATEDDFSLAANSEKLGEKLRNNLHAKTTMDLDTFLSSLNINTLGRTNSTRLANKFRTLAKVRGAMPGEIREIEGIGKFANDMVSGLAAKSDLIDELAEILTINDFPDGGPLDGKSFCITGKLSRGRNEIQEIIKHNGGTVKNSVSKGLTYLITNTPTSGTSKNKKADNYGVEKITEDQFYEMVG